MSPVKLRAEFKRTGEAMTMESLREGLDQLEAHAGVPHSARLKVNHFAQAGWEIVAAWEPEETREETPEASPFPGLDPEVIARRIRDSSGFRKIKDHPQA